MPKAKKQLTTVVNLIDTDEYDIFIGRPSIFGNPFPINKTTTREQAIEKFKEYWYSSTCLGRRANALRNLSSKKLGCYCAPKPCHGDIIAEFVNNNVKNKTRHTREST